MQSGCLSQSECEWCSALVCVVKLVTFTEWDTGWFTRRSWGGVLLVNPLLLQQYTQRCTQYEAPHLFDAVVNSSWFPCQGTQHIHLSFPSMSPHYSHMVRNIINRWKLQQHQVLFLIDVDFGTSGDTHVSLFALWTIHFALPVSHRHTCWLTSVTTRNSPNQISCDRSWLRHQVVPSHPF